MYGLTEVTNGRNAVYVSDVTQLFPFQETSVACRPSHGSMVMLQPAHAGARSESMNRMLPTPFGSALRNACEIA